LSNYGYSKETVKLVEPVIAKIDSKNKSELLKVFRDFTLAVCNKVEQRKLSPKQADDTFTLIDLYISDNHPDFVLDNQVKKILFEGMILHDSGKEFGSKVETIKELANQLS